MRVVAPAIAFVLLSIPAIAQQRTNPYACEGVASDLSSRMALSALRTEANSRAALAEQTRHTEPARSASLFCITAELYKRLGHGDASRMYTGAIEAAPDEPAYELLYAIYLRVHRGAGQRPLFHEAEAHLAAAKAKLDRLQPKEKWDLVTEERLQRSLTALYERDGIPLASRTWDAAGAGSGARLPWLFLTPEVRWERSSNDLDRTSDVRDRTAEAAFSASPARLNQALNPDQLTALVRQTTPFETSGRLRIRHGSAPAIDVFASGRHTTDAQVTNFFQPGGFNDLTLIDIGAAAEKPFRLSGRADMLARVGYHRISRDGLVEFLPEATEHIDQFEAAGALAQYAGPNRLNVSYAYVYQRIDSRSTAVRRNRQIAGGTVSYQIFRPELTSGRGRQFEPRSIDIFGGFLDDSDRFPGNSADVVIARRDYFVGMSTRGLKRVDVTVQPTWFTSQVSNDLTQDNSQLRVQGNVVIRALDEERTGGMPTERLLGLPVAFVHIVGVFHWDLPGVGSEAFLSRRLGAELWMKWFTPGKIGVTTLGVVGYAREWHPVLHRHLDLFRFRFGVGF